MIPHSALVTQPSLAIEQLVLACTQLFNHKVAAGIDSSPRNLSDAEKFLAILAAMREPGAPASLPPDLLKHVTFSVLTVAEERDLVDILTICSGMSTTVAETKGRGIMAVVVTGTLDQWRDAVVTGCNQRSQFEVCSGFNQIHSLFVGAGLGAIWKGYKQMNSGPELFYLTHER
jgi:hypothetical protein